jgi:hypothetical protein
MNDLSTRKYNTNMSIPKWKRDWELYRQIWAENPQLWSSIQTKELFELVRHGTITGKRVVNQLVLDAVNSGGNNYPYGRVYIVMAFTEWI